MRYGWPTNVHWRGKKYDEGISGWYKHNTLTYSLWRRDITDDAGPPFTTAEYNLDRIHVVPKSSVLRAPYSSRLSDWQLSGLTKAPPGRSGLFPQWWPFEHCKRPIR